MKAIKALVAVTVASGLLAAAVPASAGANAYAHYVGCGLKEGTKRSHVCHVKDKKGAFFKSFKRAVHYTVCVRFPGGITHCAHHQPPPTKKHPRPEEDTLYVNKITSTVPGKHRVTWYVKGKKVGTYFFRVKR